MNDLCKFFEIALTTNADEGRVVEDCAAYDQTLDMSVMCKIGCEEDLKAWIKENCKKIADYACSFIDSGDIKMCMSIVLNTLGIDSLTHEFILDAGGVQELYDSLHQNSVVSFSNEEEKVEPVLDYFDPEPEEEEEEPEPVIVEPVEESIVPVEPQEKVGISIPESITGGEQVSIPFNTLVDFANYINKAAETLEGSEFAESYILQKEDVDHAVKYVDAFSPTLLKEFLKHYVKTADSDIELIRITKLLDALVEFSRDYRGGASNEF